MGRKLTEAQKVKRAAQAIVKKEQKEVGPLFADQVQAPDLHDLMMQRRRCLAANVEFLHENIGGWSSDGLYVRQLKLLARRHLGPWFEALDAYCRRVYPQGGYPSFFWKRCLTTTEFTPLSWYNPNPGSAVCRLVVADAFPPPGWVPPLTPDQIPSHERKCPRCQYYHLDNEPCIAHDPFALEASCPAA